MMERNSRNPSGRRNEASRPPRFTSVAACAAAAVACIAYGVWSASQGEGEKVVSGARTTPAERLPVLSPTPDDSIPTARLTLDEGEDAAVLPVVNAHLEVSEGNEGSATVIDVSPAVRQLGYTVPPSGAGPQGANPAWLAGTIESAAAQAARDASTHRPDRR
jgi:hypothetical protein